MRKVIMKLLSISVLATLTMNVWGDTIYKCKNQQGDLLYQKTPCNEDVQTISSWVPVNKVQPSIQKPERKTISEFIIKQSGSGHYFLEGTINDKALIFVIDTGASFVALPRSIANEAHIYCKDNFNMESANGSVNVCSTTIQKLNFGPFLVKDVMAVIVPNLNQPLLGMNVLQQIKIAQDKGEMRLSPRE